MNFGSQKLHIEPVRIGEKPGVFHLKNPGFSANADRLDVFLQMQQSMIKPFKKQWFYQRNEQLPLKGIDCAFIKCV